MRRERVIFLVREKKWYVFILPWHCRNLYLRPPGSTAGSRRSAQTAGRFPGSRSANTRSTCQITDRARDLGGRAGGRQHLPEQSAGQHSRWAGSAGRARPGHRGWGTPHCCGSSTCRHKTQGALTCQRMLLASLMTSIIGSSNLPPSAWGQGGTLEVRDKGRKPVLRGSGLP